MDNNLIKQDRMRYTKNKASANLAYLAILFDVLYFVSIYSADRGNFYYNITIGVSVIYNLLFLLTVFLSSEGLKSYKLSFAWIIIVVGALQLVRIFGIPMDASRTLMPGTETYVMDQGQFIYTVVMLVLSSVCCIASGVIGLIRTHALNDINAKIASGEVNFEYNN